MTAKKLSQEREGKNTKNITCPHLEPNQSMKLISELESTSINALVHDHKLQTKEFFILWTNNSALSKASTELKDMLVKTLFLGGDELLFFVLLDFPNNMRIE